jgi:hypothetical protein
MDGRCDSFSSLAHADPHIRVRVASESATCLLDGFVTCPDFRVRRRESRPSSSASVAMAIHLHADRPQGGAAGRRAAGSISACQAAATAGGYPAFVLAASLHRGHGQGSSRRPVPLSSSRPRSGPLSRRQRRRWSRRQSQIRARPPLLPPTSPMLLDAGRLSADA